jgi:threonine dehydrogenase-like Zn-dependent dehydrogenase
MKVAYQVGNEVIGVNNEYPTPIADGKKVIIKIHYCGICGSDVHSWENRR